MSEVLVLMIFCYASPLEFNFLHAHMNTFTRDTIIYSELQFMNTVARCRSSNVINSCISFPLLSGTKSQNTALEVAVFCDFFTKEVATKQGCTDLTFSVPILIAIPWPSTDPIPVFN